MSWILGSKVKENGWKEMWNWKKETKRERLLFINKRIRSCYALNICFPYFDGINVWMNERESIQISRVWGVLVSLFWGNWCGSGVEWTSEGLFPMSLVLWRRNVPDKIVTNPHISVAICDASCFAHSLNIITLAIIVNDVNIT